MGTTGVHDSKKKSLILLETRAGLRPPGLQAFTFLAELARKISRSKQKHEALTRLKT